jgi:hypothetical protein
MRRCWSVWACSAVVCVSGCGAARVPPVATPPTATWRSNARQVVEQLRVDIATAAVAGSTRADAERALRSTSDLYALLVAYSDLDGCHAMVNATAAPDRVIGAFQPLCVRLQRAAALFARATQRSEPAALVEATRETRVAQPQLVRVMLEIGRQPGSRGEK